MEWAVTGLWGSVPFWVQRLKDFEDAKGLVFGGRKEWAVSSVMVPPFAREYYGCRISHRAEQLPVFIPDLFLAISNIVSLLDGSSRRGTSNR